MNIYKNGGSRRAKSKLGQDVRQKMRGAVFYKVNL